MAGVWPTADADPAGEPHRGRVRPDLACDAQDRQLTDS
jgi:hypothetical protein